MIFEANRVFVRPNQITVSPPTLLLFPLLLQTLPSTIALALILISPPSSSSSSLLLLSLPLSLPPLSFFFFSPKCSPSSLPFSLPTSPPSTPTAYTVSPLFSLLDGDLGHAFLAHLDRSSIDNLRQLSEDALRPLSLAPVANHFHPMFSLLDGDMGDVVISFLTKSVYHRLLVLAKGSGRLRCLAHDADQCILHRSGGRKYCYMLDVIVRNAALLTASNGTEPAAFVQKDWPEEFEGCLVCPSYPDDAMWILGEDIDPDHEMEDRCAAIDKAWEELPPEPAANFSSCWTGCCRDR